jgi:hypothetical protein
MFDWIKDVLMFGKLIRAQERVVFVPLGFAAFGNWLKGLSGGRSTSLVMIWVNTGQV